MELNNGKQHINNSTKTQKQFLRKLKYLLQQKMSGFSDDEWLILYFAFIEDYRLEVIIIVSMKNNQLFNQIKQLVQQRQLIPPQNPSFAQAYCQQQLTKKKLNPYDPRQKMNHIMKNFQQLQTYVDVEALVRCICSFKKQKSQQIENSSNIENKREPNAYQRWEKEKFLLKQKIRQKLGEQLHQKYNKQNQSFMKFIDYLEKSYNDSGKNKNYHRNNIDKSLLKKIDDQNIKQDWSFDNLRTIRNSNNYKIDHSFATNVKKQNIQQRKKHADLIHQVSTYLQIILQMQHRNKWRKAKEISKEMKQKIKNTQSKFILSKKKHTKSQTEVLFSQRPFLTNSMKTKRNIQLPVNKNRLLNISQTCAKQQQIDSGRFQKLKVQNQFTFRNRTIKEKIMKKVANFIELIEDEEKIIKEQNKTHLTNIQNLENEIRSEFMKYKQDPLFDEEGVKDVRIRALQFK